MSNGAQITDPRLDSLVPLRSLSDINEIDAILRSVVQAGRKEVHAAIEEILTGWPGRRRSELWARLRLLRDKGRGRGQHHAVWTEEDLIILQTYYPHGAAGAGRAINELLARHPDWTARIIRWKAKKVGLPTCSKGPRPWSQEEQGYLLWNVGEKPLKRIARKLGRSVNSVRIRLSSLGVSAKVRVPKEYNLHRVSKLIGVGDRTVRDWFQSGLFGETVDQDRHRGRLGPGPRLSIESIVNFCVNNPDKINAEGCDPDLLDLIEEKKVRLSAWHGSDQHLMHERSCPQCGRSIRGNSYYSHVKRCQGAVPQLTAGELQATSAGQSLSSNI